jgi:hypothetical protein
MADGGLALAGHTTSTNLPGGQKSAGSGDFWLVRTDAGGKLLWNQTYGGSGNDEANSVIALADGGLALTGWTSSVNLPGGQKSAGGNDFWLVRTDAGGKLLWNRTYGGTQEDIASALTPLADGGLALAGYTQSTILPGGQKTAGGGDFLLVRTDAWGHASCAEAGVCFLTAATACDDQNPCTADTCDSNAGCTHGNLPDGSGCGGGKTCTAGSCT